MGIPWTTTEPSLVISMVRLAAIFSKSITWAVFGSETGLTTDAPARRLPDNAYQSAFAAW